MRIFHRIKDRLFRLLAPLLKIVGLLELLGLHYKVKYYMAKVDDKLWRGSRLRSEDFPALQSNGVRTVISLCYEATPLDEASECIRLGMQYVNIKVVDNMSPLPYQLDYFCRLMADSAFWPAYVHCEAGIGRTGTFVAAYRMENGWALEEAIAESRKYGPIMPCQEVSLCKYSATIKKK